MFGRRIRKEQIQNHSSANTTEFIWDGARLLQERSYERSVVYIYGSEISVAGTDRLLENFVPLAFISLGENIVINYLHTDQVGLPKELTDEKGELIWYAKYKTWGKVTEEHNPHQGHQPFRFQNQYYDVETGLHYNLMRYYDADSGQFISQDPIGLVGGDHLYQYAPNPLMWIDPWGLVAPVVWVCVAVIVRGGVAIGRRIPWKQAIQRVRRGQDVYVCSRCAANKLAKDAFKGKPMKHKPHPDRATGSTEGRLPHVHPKQHVNSSHIFYPKK